MSKRREIDSVTGVETTGHVWDDDLKELNKPLPRWWLNTFYVCIIWAIGYWIAYPAWPTLNGYTQGLLGYSQRSVVAAELKAAAQGQGAMRERILSTPLPEILKAPELARFAEVAGRTAFTENCSACHGRGAQGGTGYPNLRDDDWLWGGGVNDIHRTIRFGIRSDHDSARLSAMPRFGLDQLLDEQQISDVADYVLAISSTEPASTAASPGATIFAEQCAACHAENGKGNTELGAPNLTDRIWLYGGDKASIVTSIRTGRGAAMPQWESRLDPVTVKSLAVYVHRLGGGS